MASYHKSTLALMCALGCFYLLISLPILQAGFWSDDSVNSLTRGLFAEAHTGFVKGAWQGFGEWLAAGRFFPVSVLSTVTVFYFCQSVWMYQSIRVICIWLSLLTVAWLIKLISRNYSTAALFLVLTPLCWSIRNVPDPLTSFAIFLPLLTTCIAFSLGSYIRFQETQKRSWLLLSFSSYAVALGTYELSVIFLCLLMIIMWLGPQPKTQWWKILVGFSWLTAWYVVVTILLRIQSQALYDGITLGKFSQILTTWWAQLISALPFSYHVFAPEPVISVSALWHWSMQQPYMVLEVTGLVLLACGSSFFCLRHSRLSPRARLCLFGLAIIWWWVPALIIAVTARYQHLVVPGKGYIAVYLQYIGVTIVLLLLLTTYYWRQWLLAIVAAMIGIAMGWSWLLNCYMVAEMNDKVSYTRQLTETVLQQQFLAEIPQQAVLVEKRYVWNSPAFYLLHAKRPVAGVVDVRDQAAITHLGVAYLFIAEHLAGKRSGYVLLASTQSHLRQNDSFTITTPRIRLVLASPRDYAALMQLLTKHLIVSANGEMHYQL